MIEHVPMNVSRHAVEKYSKNHPNCLDSKKNLLALYKTMRIGMNQGFVHYRRCKKRGTTKAWYKNKVIVYSESTIITYYKRFHGEIPVEVNLNWQRVNSILNGELGNRISKRKERMRKLYN